MLSKPILFNFSNSHEAEETQNACTSESFSPLAAMLITTFMTEISSFTQLKSLGFLALVIVLVSCQTQQNVIVFKINSNLKTFEGNGVSNHEVYGTSGTGEKFIQYVLNIRSKGSGLNDSSYLTLTIGGHNEIVTPGTYTNLSFADSLNRSNASLVYVHKNERYFSNRAPDYPARIIVKQLNSRKIKGTFSAILVKENSNSVIEVTGRFNVDNKKFERSSPY